MRTYKKLLLKKLTESGWELVTRENECEWWLEESWKIKSIRQNWGFELYILFLVDPMYEGNDKSQAVWAVGAALKIPLNRPVKSECFLAMDLQKGQYDSKLSEFVTGISEYRNNPPQNFPVIKTRVSLGSSIR